MSETSKIEWTDATFNPWRGCTKVSAGCANCYAENNFSVKMHGIKWGPKGTRVVASESMWIQPIRWDREAAAAGERRRVFCASLADAFESWQGPMLNSHGDEMQLEHIGNAGELPAMMTMQDVRNRLFRLIDQTKNIDWLLLTKRPENILPMLPPLLISKVLGAYTAADVLTRPNVWFGTSVENQRAADERIPLLIRAPAVVRFLSCEPLLGPINLSEASKDWHTQIHWVIVGGESGPHARPCDMAWIRSIVQQCQQANVACFVKQLGRNPTIFHPASTENGFPVEADFVEHIEILDKKGGDMSEWPVDLRVREFPEVNR